MAKGEELTDEQWALLKLLLPEPPRRADGRGRPWRSQRETLNGVLWILRSGARWKDLPTHFPPCQTCRRHQAWVRSGALRDVLETLAEDWREAGRIDLSECFVDGTFIVAEKGGLAVGPAKRGKGTKLMAVTDAAGLPLAVHATRAGPAEVALVQATLKASFVAEPPARLIGDKAYDSDPLDARLAAQGVAMIAPHRRGRTKPRTQDGRAPRRSRRRWKVWSGSLPGCRTSGASSPATNATLKTAWALSISAASRFCFAATYETTSSLDLVRPSFGTNMCLKLRSVEGAR